jgi:hypothetical protein
MNKLTLGQVKVLRACYDYGMKSMEISLAIGIGRSNIQAYFLAFERGYNSPYEYQKSRAKKKGFKSLYEYKKSYKVHFSKEYLKRKGFNSFYEYNEYLARKRGYGSKYDYDKVRQQKRKKLARNKALSWMIETRLRELDRSVRWLAGETGITLSRVDDYYRGYNLPKSGERLRKIFSALKVKYKSLDELLQG